MATSPNIAARYDVASLRQEEFPLTENVIYLNHAGISPMPARTVAAIQSCISAMGHNATSYFGREVLPMFESFMNDIATFINAAHPSEICPVLSTSTALNLVAQSLPWEDGDNIIFCDMEFPSNAYPWMALERRGVTCRIVPAQNGTLSIDAVDANSDGHTRVVAVSAVQFFSGARADLAALGAYCRERNILLAVDAIQAIGHLPIDVTAMNIDVLATGGQKSLLALTGAGFLYVRNEAVETMQPNHIGPNAVDGWEHWLDYNLTPRPGAIRFLMGTPNVPGMLSVLSSLKLINELGRENIDDYTTGLATYALNALNAAGYLVITPHAPDEHGPIVTFKYSESDTATDDLVQRLAQHQIMVTKHLDAAGHPYVRISVHCYNTTSDIDRFLELL
ncbi:MAG: aminotransferase class V-fold PLP-dependent enzyme [Chloroflexi bacterium]|nr:aminotransferase class V-fold PLP-dependent enzyme [Chloroflexota bacterium]